MGKIRAFFAVAVVFAIQLGIGFAQTAPTFSQIIVFGDSLSDDGNVAHRTRDAVGFSYPSSNPQFNYSDYRFTNDFNTNPASMLYRGTWHEQLAKSFLNLSNPSNALNSLDGGTDYAFGGATTKDGTQDRTVINNPFPFTGGNITVTIDNIGKQVNDYLAGHTPDPNALYIIWGGGNDLFDDNSAANVTNTANRVAGLIQRLGGAGARNFLIPNVPPLGAVPNSLGDPNRVADLDQASADYRAQLSSAIASTEGTLAGGGITIHVYMLDVWLNTIRLLGQPQNYGFTNVTDSSQGQSVNPDKYLFWDDLHPTTAGHHEIANEAFRLLSGQIGALGKAANMSARGRVDAGEAVLISGFIITGDLSKKVVVRALGPSLASFGVTGALPDPTLTVFDSNHAVVATNDNWRQSSQQAEIAASGFAPPNDLDSAVIADLPPGAYTAVVSGVNGATGIALAEVYDAAPSTSSVLHNVSTRAFVGTGDNVLIAGLIVGSGEPPLIVIRAIGPELSSYGIQTPLLDPTLELFDANGTQIASNDDWKDLSPTAVKAVLLGPSDDRESAIVASLSAGNYTAVVAGKNNTTGVALVEAYRVE